MGAPVIAVPGWADVAAVDWRHAPDDWDHVALASYAEQLPEFHAPGSAALRSAVRGYLERHRTALAADHPRSRLFRQGGLRGRMRRREARSEREQQERRESERRRLYARAQPRDGHGQFRRREE